MDSLDQIALTGVFGVGKIDDKIPDSMKPAPNLCSQAKKQHLSNQGESPDKLREY